MAIIKLTFIAALLLSIVIPFTYFLNGERNKTRFKHSIIWNSVFFFGLLLFADILMFSGKVSAAEATDVVNASSEGLKYIAAALSTGLSCIGGGIAVASAASAALGALSEDSSIMGKALIFVALAEGIALYGLLISFSILFAA